MKLALTLPGNQTIVPPAEIKNTIAPAGTYGLSYFGIAIEIFFGVAAILAVFFIIYGGIKIITSEGDPKNIQGARNIIIYAIIGLSVVFFSYLIINIFGHFLGVDFLNPTGIGSQGSPCTKGPC